jgi:hypothetical protein
LRTEDWQQLFAIAADPLIRERHRARERHKEEYFRDYFREALESGGAVVAIDRNTLQIIGASRYFVFLDPDSGSSPLGTRCLQDTEW